MDGRRSSSSSSGEEDGDAEWRAAIDSVTSAPKIIKHDSNGTHDRNDEKHKHQTIKHYQIKAQKLLDDMLDKTIEVVTNTTDIILEKHSPPGDTGVRLFKRAPSGIVFDHADEVCGPKKKPKIVPGEELEENSKKFRKQLQSVTINGADIIGAARAESQKSLAKLEAREARAKAAAKREEERVAELKKIRGERWLPCIAKEMRRISQKSVR